MIEIIPRPYQARDIPRIKGAFSRVKRVLYVSCCGSGKTVVFSKIAQGITLKGNSAAIIAHRKELITQCSDKLNRFNVSHGIIKAGFEPDYSQPIQVASVQTLYKRLSEIDPDMLIYDEAHHSQAQQAQTVIAAYPSAILLGVTASPIFGNGKTMAGFYDEMIIGPSVRELVDDGYLVDTKVFAPPILADLEGADYDNISDLEERMNKRRITGDAIKHYEAHVAGLQTIVYVTTVKHGQDVAEQFRERGHKFYSIDGTMEDGERDQLLKDFASGAITGLVSCDLISEGTDIPSAQVAIKLRPTKSLGLHIQQDGRVNRPFYAVGMPQDTREQRLAAIAASAKPCAWVFDHVENWLFHGLPDDEWEWSLTEEPKRKSQGGTSVPIQQCQQCDRVFPPAEACPHCGFIAPKQERKLKLTKGQLKQITRAENDLRKKLEAEAKAERARKKEQAKIDKAAAAVRAAEIRRRTNAARSFDQLKALGKELGYADSWAIIKWKHRR